MRSGSTDEWVRAWAAAIPAGAKGDDRYRTSRELQKALGLGTDRTLRMLHDLDDAGRLMTRRVRRKILGGTTMTLQAYALKDAGRKA